MRSFLERYASALVRGVVDRLHAPRRTARWCTSTTRWAGGRATPSPSPCRPRDGHISVSLHLKFPSDLKLADAHDAAQRTISQLPSVDAVQTHLEPLERLITERRRHPVDPQTQRRHIETLVRRETGHATHAVRLLPTDAGPVLFLTLALPDAPTLTAAHQLASQLEERLRDQQPTLTDVVIHTEPA